MTTIFLSHISTNNIFLSSLSAAMTHDHINYFALNHNSMIARQCEHSKSEHNLSWLTILQCNCVILTATIDNIITSFVHNERKNVKHEIESARIPWNRSFKVSTIDEHLFSNFPSDLTRFFLSSSIGFLFNESIRCISMCSMNDMKVACCLSNIVQRWVSVFLCYFHVRVASISTVAIVAMCTESLIVAVAGQKAEKEKKKCSGHEIVLKCCKWQEFFSPLNRRHGGDFFCVLWYLSQFHGERIRQIRATAESSHHLHDWSWPMTQIQSLGCFCCWLLININLGKCWKYDLFSLDRRASLSKIKGECFSSWNFDQICSDFHRKLCNNFDALQEFLKFSIFWGWIAQISKINFHEKTQTFAILLFLKSLREKTIWRINDLRWREDLRFDEKKYRKTKMCREEDRKNKIKISLT